VSTQSTKGWRGNIKIVYRTFSDTLCIEAADKVAVNAADNEEHIQECSPSLDGGLEAVFALGNRTPEEIVEGNIDLSFRIRRKFVDRKFAHLAGVDSSWMLPGKVCVGIFPHGYVSGEPAIYICGKFANWNLPLTQADLEVEELDFIGQCISTDVVT
jgi:hypothetical protein